ncbi:MAG: hypothetical protein M1433_00295 [Candidatus Parvarchaeota archaeon]|nr:hypothetical protein [Candidatus Parvarchaeota archaeon]
MAENDELKHVEEEIKKEEKSVDSTIETEKERIEIESKKLAEEEKKLKELEAEKERLESIKSVEKGKTSEIEIQINTDSLKKFAKIAYSILIEKRVLFYLLLILAVIIGISIRMASLPALGATPLIGNNYLGQGGSLTGLDPYIFYVETNHIIATGNVPTIEHLEYLPIGFITRTDRMLISFFDAFMFRFMQPLVPGATSMTWAMLYPVIVAALATILLFLLGLELFDSYSMAALSAFIFPVFQTLLNRTTAGFSTKDAMGFLFILLTIYFLAKVLRSKDTRSKIVFGFLVAFSVGLTDVTSGFSKFTEFLVPIVYILMILMNYAKKGDLYSYLPFGLFLGISASYITITSSWTSYILHNIQFYPMILAYVMVLFKLLVYDKHHHKLKIPFVNAGMSVGIYSVIIVGIILAAVGKLGHVLSYVMFEIQYPLGLGTVNPVSLTVAEFGQVTLAGKVCDAGGLLGNCGAASTISINYLLLMVGGILLMYYLLRRFKHWYIPFLAVLPFILAMVVGLYTPGSGAYSILLVFIFGAFIPILHWILHRKEEGAKRTLSPIIMMTLISIVLSISFFFSLQTNNYFKYGMFGIAIILVLTFAFDTIEEDRGGKTTYIIMLVFFLLATLFANLQNQLLEGNGFMGVIVVPFGIVMFVTLFINYVNRLMKLPKNTFRIVAAVVILIAVAFIAYDLNISLNFSYLASQSSGSGLAIWGPTLQWLNYSTPVNSSVIAWWDYGYWIEAIGNRTSVADGSNTYGYQSMIAKYFFESTSPYQYFTYLNYIHRPTYALISGSEVEKFSAISIIAGNETQFSPMVESNSVPNTNNVGGDGYKYLATFGGSSSLGLAPIEASINVGGVTWSASDTLLVQVVIPFNSSGNSSVIGNPYGEVYNELTQQVSGLLPISQLCIYNSGCKIVSTNSSAIPGGVEMLTSANNATLKIGGYPQYKGGYINAPISLNAYGNAPGLLFLPEKNINNLFVKLYLLNETVPGFTLVFSDGLPVNSLLSIDNQVLTNINIYKINYSDFTKYMLTGQCSVSQSAVNYCANLSYLPAVFDNNSALIQNTPIP